MTSLTLPLVFDLSQVQLTDRQFYQLCINNPDIPLERNAQGALIVMSPVGGDSGSYEMELGIDLGNWNRQTQRGKVFSSSTLFKLPGGGDRSPDAAWIELSRWRSLSAEQRQKFPSIAPDFVIELRSRSDLLAVSQRLLSAAQKERYSTLLIWAILICLVYFPFQTSPFNLMGARPESACLQELLRQFLRNMPQHMSKH